MLIDMYFRKNEKQAPYKRAKLPVFVLIFVLVFANLLQDFQEI